MKHFNDIEKEYLNLKPLDNVALEKFYTNHIVFFSNISIDNAEQFSKSLQMLIDITCSYSFANRHTEAIKLMKQVKTLIPTQIHPDIKDNINRLYFWIGQSHLALKNHRQALSYFKAYQSTNQDKENIEILMQICRDGIQNKILLWAAYFGLIMLVIKYSTKYIFINYQSSFTDRLGWVGALILIVYGLLYYRTSPTRRSPKT